MLQERTLDSLQPDRSQYRAMKELQLYLRSYRNGLTCLLFLPK